MAHRLAPQFNTGIKSEIQQEVAKGESDGVSWLIEKLIGVDNYCSDEVCRWYSARRRLPLFFGK